MEVINSTIAEYVEKVLDIELYYFYLFSLS
jgi:hypothetical protein